MNREQEKVGKNKTKPQVSLHREWQRDVEVPYEHLITVHSGQKYRVRFLPHQLKKVLTFGELFHLPQLYLPSELFPAGLHPRGFLKHLAVKFHLLANACVRSSRLPRSVKGGINI